MRFCPREIDDFVAASAQYGANHIKAEAESLFKTIVVASSSCRFTRDIDQGRAVVCQSFGQDGSQVFRFLHANAEDIR